MKMMIMMITLNSLMALMSNNPVALTIIIIINSLLISLLVSFLISTNWFSLVLFLIFMGGLMVLFVYITSLASNEKFNIQVTSPLKLISLSLFIILLSDSPLFKNFILSTSNISLSPKQLIMMIYHQSSLILIISLILYLLMALIIMVSIISLSEGPLRNTLK